MTAALPRGALPRSTVSATITPRRVATFLCARDPVRTHPILCCPMPSHARPLSGFLEFEQSLIWVLYFLEILIINSQWVGDFLFFFLFLVLFGYLWREKIPGNRHSEFSLAPLCFSPAFSVETVFSPVKIGP